MNSKNRTKNISVFAPPIRNTKPIETASIFDIYETICADKKLKKITEDYREKGLIKQDTFAVATFGGEFSERKKNGLIQKSNLLVLDIDNLEDAKALKERVIKNPYITLCFISPSGIGLKIIVRYDMPNIEHIDIFKKTVTFFKALYNVTVDESGKDISRACFLCYDGNAHFNDNAKSFTENSFDFLNNEQKKAKQIEYFVSEIEKKDIDITAGYENWLHIGFALASELEEDGREYFHRISQFNSEYDNEKCDKQFDNCLNSNGNGITIATFFHKCKEADISFNLASVKTSSKPVETKQNIEFKNSITTANKRLDMASKLPPIKKLFGEFWGSNEVAIFFGDTGLGKSILSIQLADCLSKGKSLFELENENPPLKVLFYDFELSHKQFEKRYTNNGMRYEFNDNFLFDILDYDEFLQCKDKKLFTTFEDWIFAKIQSGVKDNAVNVVIIDNITFLTSQSNQDAEPALQLMRKLKHLKDELGIAVLVLAHPPKIPRNEVLTVNHLGGSKHLSNLADVIFTIGRSGLGYEWCYLKQIKVRSDVLKYGEQNVMSIWKEHKNQMLAFDFASCTTEQEHFQNNENKEHQKSTAKELYNVHKSYRKVANVMGISHTQVKRLIDE